MTTIQVCRTCLAHDTRMYKIANTPLQCFYERITNLTLNTQDESMSEVCYICYHLLKKCKRFTESAVRANDVLEQINKSGIQITKQFVASFGQRHLFTYYNTPVTHVNAVKKVVEIPVVKTEVEDWTVKIKIEPEEMAEDAMGNSENTLEECEMQINSIAPNNDDIQSITIKRENEGSVQESVQETSGQGSEVVDADEYPVNQEFVTCSELKVPEMADEEENPLDHSLEANDSVTLDNISLLEEYEGWQSSDQEYVSEETSDGGPAPKKRKSKKKRGRPPSKKKASDDKPKKEATTSKEKTKPIITKIFECQFCEKTFNKKSTLTSHVVRQHTGTKPFTCNYCERKFTKLTILQKHTLQHLV